MNPDNPPKLPTTRTRGADRVLVDVVREIPVDTALRHGRKRLLLGLLIAIVVLVTIGLIRRLTLDRPVTYRSDEDHFLYGSIGSEPGGSLLHPVGGMLPPYQVFAVLPEMFPDKLPGGYASLGLVFEKERNGQLRNLPVGVSRRRRLGMDMVGLNCAVCHVGTFRTRPDGPRRIVVGMPSHQLDLQTLFSFVLDSVLDPRFTGDNLVGHVEARFGSLGTLDRWVMKKVLIPQLRENTLLLRSKVGLLFSPQVSRWGHGRVDTFNPYKALQFNWPLERLSQNELIASSDFPAVWNQAPREGMNLHWDGNNASLDERNLSAGLGAGITPVTADHSAIARVKRYIRTLPPPPWPREPDMPLDLEAARRGETHYRRYCAECHDFGAARVGKVEPLREIGTDPARFNSYTLEFSANQNTLFPNSPHRFRSFKKTSGYSNQPLDGIWARAPYLHNGSVPTLADLLEPPEKRPVEFYRGYDVYDAKRVGFVSNVPEEHGKKFFRFRVRDDQGNGVPGNSNAGHLYGTDLPAPAKRDLLEYLKTL